MQLITGVVGAGRNLAVLGQQVDEDDNPVDLWTAGFWSDGNWISEIDLDFNPVALCPLADAEDAWAILGSGGEVLWVPSAKSDPNGRKARVDGGDPVGFTTICSYGSGVAAAQLGQKVFWSNGSSWKPLGSGLPPADNGRTIGFEAMAVAGDELVGVGWGGEIWWMRDETWAQVDLAVNTILTGVSAFDGEILACGRLGIILKGRGDSLEVVDHQQTEEDFWSIVSHKGKVFVSSMRAIYELTDEMLRPVDDDSEIGSYYRLSANDQILISVGARCAMIFEGVSWKQIL